MKTSSNQTRIKVTIEIGLGQAAIAYLPADTTHLSRNNIETIEDTIASARRRPEPIPEGLRTPWHELPNYTLKEDESE